MRLKSNLFCPMPYARVSTFENAVNHSGGTIRVKTTSPVKACVADDLRPLAYAAGYFHTGRVVIRRLGKALCMAGSFSQAPAPHTPEACDRDQHFYTSLKPFVLLALNVQLFLQVVDVSEPRWGQRCSVQRMRRHAIDNCVFTDMPSTRRDNAVRVRSFVANFVFVSFSSRKYSSLSPTT